MRCNWSRASPNQLLLRPQNKALGARIILTPWTRRKYIQRYISGSSVEAAPCGRRARQAPPSARNRGLSSAAGSESLRGVLRQTRPTSRCEGPQTPQLSNKARGGYDVYPSMHCTQARAAQAGQWVHCKPRKSIPACV